MKTRVVQALCNRVYSNGAVQQPYTAALYSSRVQQPCVQNPCQPQTPHHVHEQICPSRAPTTLSRARPPTPAHPRIGEQHSGDTDAPQTLQTIHGTIGGRTHTPALHRPQVPRARPQTAPQHCTAFTCRFSRRGWPALSVCARRVPGECRARYMMALIYIDSRVLTLPRLHYLYLC